jgi:hypothetical protein
MHPRWSNSIAGGGKHRGMSDRFRDLVVTPATLVARYGDGGDLKGAHAYLDERYRVPGLTAETWADLERVAASAGVTFDQLARAVMLRFWDGTNEADADSEAILDERVAAILVVEGSGWEVRRPVEVDEWDDARAFVERVNGVA